MTDKIEDTGFDPEEIFNEGVTYQAEQADTELREQIATEMIAAGQDPDEVEELLFDPVPRRGRRGRKRGKIDCSPAQRRTMPQICKGGRGYDPAPRHRRRRKYHVRHAVRRYDPAPVGGYRAAARRYYKKRGGAKGLMTGLKPLILPGATLATVYEKYQQRATTLKAAGAQIGTPPHLVNGVWDALMYDFKNRPTTSAMDRFKANASDIISPALLGVGIKYASKKVKLHPKVNQVASMGGDALIGVAIGKVISTFLDPPDTSPAQTQVQQPIQVVTPSAIQVMQSSGIMPIWS